jgi:hypothetical protein
MSFLGKQILLRNIIRGKNTFKKGKLIFFPPERFPFSKIKKKFGGKKINFAK